MQPEPTLLELIHFNNWANQQVFDACQELTEAQLEATQPGAYGTIRDTIAHILRAECGYLRHLTGSYPQPDFDWKEKPSVAAMGAFAPTVAAALVDMVNTVPPTKEVQINWDGTDTRFHGRAILIQIIHHGMEHRTNITTILSQEGLSSPDIAGWRYLETHRDRFAYHEPTADA